MATLPFDTINYSANGKESQDLDTSKPLKSLNLQLLMDYTTGSGGSILYNGRPGRIINDLVIGGGKDTVFEADGEDLYYLLYVLNKKAPVETIITAGAGANKSAKIQMEIPIALNPLQITTPKFRVKWNGATSIGADHTINATSINGSYFHVSRAMTNLKTLPLAKSNTTGKNKVLLDAEGRLSGILMLTYANATPYALRDHLTDIDLLIEGDIEINDLRWEEAKDQFGQYVDSDGAYITGIGYIDLQDRNIVPGSQSFLRWEGDNTASDVKIYQLFERVLGSEPEPKQVNPSDLKVKKPGLINPLDDRNIRPGLGRSFL